MGQILTNVDDEILETYRRRAAESGTTVEEEARRALVASASAEALVKIDAVRRQIGQLSGPTLLDDIKRDRKRDAARKRMKS